jgi:hypothetical protein
MITSFTLNILSLTYFSDQSFAGLNQIDKFKKVMAENVKYLIFNYYIHDISDKNVKP